MRRVSPSVLAREELHRLLSGGADREANIVSVFVEAVTRMVVQELIEGEQADYLGGRGRYERRGDGQVGWRNGYERGRCAPPRVRSRSRCRRSVGPRRRSGRRC
jgi:hypothetical protein